MKTLVEYLETLTVTQGRLAGQNMTVLPWEQRFVRGAFKPTVETAALSIGRGNGKTAFVSGVACAALDGPLAVSRGEVVIVASSFDQARIDGEHVLAFMGDKLEDKSRWRVWDTAQQFRVENRETGARVRCIGSDPRRAHGLAPVLILADEPAQWPVGTGQQMVAALRTAAGKQPFCRFIALGTRPDDPDHWFQKMLDGGSDYSQTHAARSNDPPFQRRTWKRANPSLDFMPDLERAIRKEAQEAKTDPSMLATFRALRLNLGVSDTLESVLLEPSTWRRIESDDAARSGPYVLGVDLGTSAAMSATAAYWPDTGRLESFACFPEIPSLAERGLADGVGALYQRMAERSELVTRGRRVSDLPALLLEVRDRWGAPAVVVCDRWRAEELAQTLETIGFPRARLERRGQGYRDGAQDVRGFRSACLSDKVSPVPSLLLRSALASARTVSDTAGNAKLAVRNQGGRNSARRDDAIAASILAVATGYRLSRRPQRKRLAYAVV